MKNDRVDTVFIIGILVSIILFIITCVFQVKDGYARDAGIYVSPIISYSLWILLGLCVISLIVFMIVQKNSSKKVAVKASVLLLVVLIIGGLWIIIGWQTSFNNVKQIVSFDDMGQRTYESKQADTIIKQKLTLQKNRQFE